MKVLNQRSFHLYLPYAGVRKGWLIKAGKPSPELPADRFYDQLLQRDWKRGTIDVVLNEQDKLILGAAIADLVHKPVAVADNAVTPAPVPSVAPVIAPATPAQVETPTPEPTPQPTPEAPTAPAQGLQTV